MKSRSDYEWVSSLVFFVLLISTLIAVFILQGCAATNENDVEVQRAYFEAQARIAEAENLKNVKQGPTVEMLCGSGCKFERFTVNIPGDEDNEYHTILNRPKTSAETGADVSKAYARPIESIFTMGLGIFGVNEIVKNVGKYSGNNNEVSGTGNSLSVSEGNHISSSDGNQRDTITSTDTSSAVGDTISSDSNDKTDNSDNSKTVNNYPITDSNNTNNSNQGNPMDNTNNSNQGNSTAPPNYPPVPPPPLPEI